MTHPEAKKIEELLARLETLESQQPTPDQAPIHAIARDALVDELARLTRHDWLRVYRRGDSIDAISTAG